MRFGKVFSGLALAVVMAGAARAQTVTCPPVKPGEELRDLPEIRADRATKTLDTTLRVQLRTLCLPTFQNGVWLNLPAPLRSYGFPDSGGWTWGYPGPVLRLRKADTEGGQGDGLSILLRNELPAGTEDNDTNLHFHGGHVSPQQDDVMLVLRPDPHPPAPSPGPPESTRPGRGGDLLCALLGFRACGGAPLPGRVDSGGPGEGTGVRAAGHGHPGSGISYGQVRYQIDPLLWTQPEGTHWYHPHRHGSVALQVANGMAGPLIVEGPFDDWLRMFYGWTLKEKILVIQRVEPGTALYGRDDAGPGPLPAPLINGQVQPVITMAPGEVQRWRWINATVGPLSQIDFRFPPGAAVRQIAMDGVRFAPENYDRQPLPSQLSPGNRADFLVQAPQAAGDHPVTYGLFAHLAGAEGQGGTLVTIRVAPSSAPVAKGFPGKEVWPPMPSYLKDVAPEEIQGTVDLSFNGTATDLDISGVKFDGSCAGVTTTLGTALEWNVRNTTDALHPFHIHINPFQVIRHAGRTYSPPYVWQDTIALPSGSVAAPASVLLRQRYTDFTGEYVLHCHFLGHEDRGMMMAVQTVCPNDPGSFGKARPGGQPECVPGNRIEASPKCPANLLTPRK